MRFAILSGENEDGLYHYLPDGGNLTVCGLEAQQIIVGEPEDRSLCEICKENEIAEFSSTLSEMDDESLVSLGWALVRQKEDRHYQILLVDEAVARGLPVCRGTKQTGPHAAIPLLHFEEQSIPCPLCGDVKFN